MAETSDDRGLPPLREEDQRAHPRRWVSQPLLGVVCATLGLVGLAVAWHAAPPRATRPPWPSRLPWASGS